MQSLRDWYCFSRNHRRQFLADLGENTNGALVTLIQNELNQPPIKSLRTLDDIKGYKRETLPCPTDLKQRTPNEQHLQYLFMHRGYFRHPFESVLTREYPSCDRRNDRSAVVDLLAFDNKRKQPLIVELKRAEATDPLFGVVLEGLHHWAFFCRNSLLLAAVLRRGGHDCPDACSVQLAIAAPTQYYVETQRRSAISPARNREYSRAIEALTYLAERIGLSVPLVAVDDNWRDTGTDFSVRLWWQAPTAEPRG